MKKFIPLIVVIVVIVTVVVYRSNSLETQLLNQTSQGQVPGSARTIADCKKLSEVVANKCYLKLALLEKDDSYCDQISRMIDKRKCEREVQLAP